MSLSLATWSKNLCRQASLIVMVLALCACSGTKRLEVGSSFPIPLMEKTQVNLGIHLDEELLGYVHKESIEKNGSWEVSVGPAQRSLFNNLAIGVFTGHSFVDSLSVQAPLEGVLKPTIQEVQFSLPAQTRSEYYEVWIRYEFELYDRAGTKIGTWKLPAYGKAKKDDHGSSSNGLQAAAMAACRDAMAFFSINFAREPSVQQWLAAGKPLMPSVPSTQAAPETNSPADKANEISQPTPESSTQDESTVKSASVLVDQA